MRRWLLPLTLCLALPGCWQKDCSKWSFMSAGEYWGRVRDGCCYEIVETRDEYICLYVQLEEGREFYRVDRRSLTREVQEESYRLAVQRNIAWLKKELARRKTIDPRRLDYVRRNIEFSMRSLADYTGLYFDFPEQWIRWWEENHERLRLAPDDRHVIVGR